MPHYDENFLTVTERIGNRYEVNSDCSTTCRSVSPSLLSVKMFDDGVEDCGSEHSKRVFLTFNLIV